MVVALWFFQRPGVASRSNLASRNPHRVPDRKEFAVKKYHYHWGYSEWDGRFYHGSWLLWGPHIKAVFHNRRRRHAGLRLARREQPC